MYAQREKPKEKKKQVTVVVNQTKTSPRLGEDCLAHRSNGLGQRHDKAQIRNAAARYCQPSPSTIQRMDDDKDKDKKQSSENLDNLQLSLELLGMTPGVGMIADAANLGISLFRGNYADALINMAAMVPIVGQGVTGGKLATKAASSATDVLGIANRNVVDSVSNLSKTSHSKKMGRATKEVRRGAESVNAQSALRAKLSGLEKAQKSAAKVRQLPDGRIRYFTKEVPARSDGLTRGASFVTEYNPKTANVRQWMESYNHSGQVNRVHPKSINGQTINSQHYPPTAKELGL